MGLLGDLKIVVVKSDQAETQRHAEHDPDVRIHRVRPQDGRDQHAGQDHQPAHRRRALFGDEMRLRPVGADRLALALLQAQQVDDRPAEQKHEHQRGDDGAAGAEGNVTKDVEERDLVGKLGQPIEHRINLAPVKTFYLRTILSETGSGLSDHALAGSSAGLPEYCRSNALTMGPIFEPNDPLTMTASPPRKLASTAGSSCAAVSA